MLKKLFLILLLLALPAAPRAARAQDLAGPAFAVGNGTPVSCTEAALKAALRDHKIITFNCGPNPVTIPLNSEITIDADAIIYGAGKITLDGQGKTRMFHVVPYIGLMLDGLTLRNGRAIYTTANIRGRGQGGAIFVDVWGSLTVQRVTFLNNIAESPIECTGGGAIRLNGFNYAEIFDSTFTGNSAPNGGAINNLTSDLYVRGSLFDSNQATHDRVNLPKPYTGCDGGGGAIFIDGASPPKDGGTATIRITGSTFRSNKTLQSGGAIFSYLYSNETLTVDRSTFEGNQALFTLDSQGDVPSGLGLGGGLYWASEHTETARLFRGKYVVTNSTFSGNHADRYGGAIFISRSTLEMTNNTIADNEAANDKNLTSPGFQGRGGGVYILIGPGSDIPVKSIFKNVTVAYNEAGNAGGGIAGSTQQGSSMLTRLQNSVVANNTVEGSSAEATANCLVTLVEAGGNVQTGGSTRCTSSITVAGANLGALGSHGGPTKTVPLQSGSAAINRGVAGCPAVDQRGYGRNGVCDSGAFEYNGLALDEKQFFPAIRN
jgi:hypothetical protein